MKPVPPEEALLPITESDIEAALSRSTSSALGVSDEACQTPNWDDEHVAGLMKRKPKTMDTAGLSANELVMTLELQEMEQTIAKLESQLKEVKNQAAVDRSEREMAAKRLEMYAEENVRILELLDQHDVENPDKYSIEKLERTSALSKAEEEEQEAQFAEDAAMRAKQDAEDAALRCHMVDGVSRDKLFETSVCLSVCLSVYTSRLVRRNTCGTTGNKRSVKKRRPQQSSPAKSN